MLWLGACPRCKGDVELDRDHYGWYRQCLQCGHLRDLQTVVQVKDKITRKKALRIVRNTRMDRASTC